MLKLSNQEKIFRQFIKALFAKKDIEKIQLTMINKSENKIATLTLSKDLFKIKKGG